MEIDVDSEAEANRYCSRCGLSLIPLEVSHLSADCADCGKRKFFVRMGDGGKGLKIEEGEGITVKIPPMSLRPGPSKFFKPGLSWFLRMLLFPPALRSPAINSDAIIGALEEHFNHTHRNSHVLADMGIDFDNPPDGYDFADYFESIKNNEASPELWAFNGLLHLGRAQEELKNGNVEAAFVSIHAATRCSAIVTSFGDIEETLWRGYQWNLKVFEVSGVQVGDPAKIEALEELATKLTSISPVALHDLLKTEDIKTKLEIPHLANEEIKNVIEYVWETKKEQKEEFREERRFKFDKTNMWVGLVGTLLGAVIGAVFAS